MVHETVTMQGHLIDSDILRKAFARIVEEGGDFDIEEFRVGKSNDDASFIRLGVSAADGAALDRRTSKRCRSRRERSVRSNEQVDSHAKTNRHR